MFLQKLMESVGMHIEAHNILVDYMLPDGKSWAHGSYQMASNGIEITDLDIITQVRNDLPIGSRAVAIFEVFGDYELPELEALACSDELCSKETRAIYLDESLAKEYIAEN